MLTTDECAHFGSALEVNTSVELCTGKKTKFDYVYQFRRVFTKDGTKFTFRPEGKVFNTLGISASEAKYDFYLGRTDSCQGMK